MIAVDARFARDTILIDGTEADEILPALVEVNLPGLTVALFPHETQELILALAATMTLEAARQILDRLAAQTAERAETRALRRDAAVDEQLRSLDQ